MQPGKQRKLLARAFSREVEAHETISRPFRRIARVGAKQANEAYRLFRANPSHPSLSFKQVSPRGPVYSVRVGLHYRALAIRQPDCLLWFWIGSHAEYDKMLSRL